MQWGWWCTYLLVHLEVCPVGHVLLSEPWEQGKDPSAFLGTRGGSGGLSACIPERLCQGFQADSSVIQVQKRGQYSHPGDPCTMTDRVGWWRQADLRAETFPMLTTHQALFLLTAGLFPCFEHKAALLDHAGLWAGPVFPKKIPFIVTGCRFLPTLSTLSSVSWTSAATAKENSRQAKKT